MEIAITLVLLVPLACAVIVWFGGPWQAEGNMMAGWIAALGASVWLLWVTGSILWILWR
jgi:membrane protein YdbS with pleckstrin-like domain